MLKLTKSLNNHFALSTSSRRGPVGVLAAIYVFLLAPVARMAFHLGHNLFIPKKNDQLPCVCVHFQNLLANSTAFLFIRPTKLLLYRLFTKSLLFMSFIAAWKASAAALLEILSVLFLKMKNTKRQIFGFKLGHCHKNY